VLDELLQNSFERNMKNTIRIAHIADIHIKGLARHAEHRQVFCDFDAKCEQLKVDHIFVAGDLFHTKTTGISPEYIDLLSWWLSDMARIAPVHIILGNHDGNLVNLSRQDAISPIVQALQNDRIHLYKQSGVYQFEEGYNWCVFSLFDEQGWERVAPTSDGINIACYHGPVSKAKTDSGWEVEGGTSIDMFEPYDITMLGDIHTTQFLGTRTIDGEQKPWIGYPGSCIQQNYSEENERGFFVWDIREKNSFDVSFHKLANPIPFVTLTWNNSITELHENARKYPIGSRFRIISHQKISQKDSSEIISFLKSDYKAAEVTFKSDSDAIRESALAATSSIVKKTDLRDVNTLMKLLKDFHSKKETDNFWAAVEQHVSKIVAQIGADDTPRNVKWSLDYLAWSNTYAYGEDNVINFSNLNGVIGIFGPNRSGKSSIIGTILYTLCNATDRGAIKNLNVINNKKDHCRGKALITVDGTQYAIERQTVKTENKRGIYAPTQLNVFKVENGIAEDLAGEQRNDTEKVIRQLIGLQEDYQMTSLSAQDDVKLFLAQGSAKRRQIISRFINLDIFDKMHALAKASFNDNKSALKLLPEREWSKLKNDFNQRSIEIDQQLVSIVDTINELAHALDELKEKRSKLVKERVITQTDVLSQTNKVKSLTAKVVELQSSIESNKSALAKSEDKIKKIANLKKDFDKVELTKQLEQLRELEMSILTLKHSYEKQKTSLEQSKKLSLQVESVPCDGKGVFAKCKFIKDACDARDKLVEQTELVESLKSEFDVASSSISKEVKNSLTDKLTKLEQLNDLETKLQSTIASTNILLVKSENQLETLTNDLDLATKTLEEYEKCVSPIDEKQIIAKEIDSCVAKQKTLDKERMKLATEQGKIQGDIEKLDSERQKRESLLSEMRLFEVITSAFSKHGIPSIIAATQLPIINTEIASILQGIVDFTIELEFDQESDSTEIYITDSEGKRIIELGSGMEKVIASIAIRVALINISSLPKTDMFIIDEGFGALDDLGVEACNRLLVSLKRYFKNIIVITHVEGVKDTADYVLDIVRKNGCANVVYN
jgi:DNA repair exonuclease SbcCD ATPase subunit/DNA repair exonuclease SbcCD nuclease subunit